MGYWQKESEFGKKVGCFKAPLGSLGLRRRLQLTIIEKTALIVSNNYGRVT